MSLCKTICILCLLPVLSRGQDVFTTDVMEVRIGFTEEHWHDTLVVRKQRDSKDGLLAEVVIDGIRYNNVEVRYKGNSSFHGALKSQIGKLPLHLKAAKGEAFAGGYKTLKMSNNFRDPSYIREILAYRIIGTYMPVPKTMPAVGFINGNYAGVFTITEGIEKAFIRRTYGTDAGRLIKCEPEFSGIRPQGCPERSFASLEYLGEDINCYRTAYDTDDDADLEIIMHLARALDKTDADLADMLNVHQVLWMHALNNVLVNLDSYLGLFCHNYYLYCDTSGYIHPLMWDLNLAFGGFHTLKRGVNVELVRLSPVVHDKYDLTNRPLLTNLLRQQSYGRLYFSMIKTILEDWFVNERYLDTARAYQEMIDPWVLKEEDPQYPYADFSKNLTSSVKRGQTRSVIGIGQLMKPRTKYLIAHSLINRQEVGVRDWTAEPTDDGLQISLHTDRRATGVTVMYAAGHDHKFRGRHMSTSDGMTWDIVIPSAGHVYFVMKNANSVVLYPKRAPKEALSMMAVKE